MGPISRYVGPWVPAEPQPWQDPVPPVSHELIGDADIADLKRTVLDSGLTVSQLVHTAWSAAASYRGTDRRGGANGARLRLAPQKDWAVNAGTADVVAKLDEIRASYGKPVSLADLVVLAGCAAVEKAAADAGVTVTVPFTPGRTDASQEQTDPDTFRWLEPRADGFRNWVQPGSKLSPETLLVDRAFMLELTAKEMTVLVGGLRVLGATTGDVRARRLHRPRRRALAGLLPHPARPRRHLADLRRRGRLRGDRLLRRGRAHRHQRRPGLRLALDPARHRRGLRRSTTPRRSSSTTSSTPGTR